jgi:protein phosphatase
MAAGENPGQEEEPDVTLRIPGNALVVLIGPAGAGKTTLAARHFPAGAVLSSDAFRARIGSGESDQSVTGSAFAALHRALEARLAAGRLVVVDATNATRAARMALTRRAGTHGAPVIGILLDLPGETVLRRNAGRGGAGAGEGRLVPEDVVHRHLAALAGLDDARLRAEGFMVVRRFRTTGEVDSLQVMLEP